MWFHIYQPFAILSVLFFQFAILVFQAFYWLFSNIV